MDNEHMFDGTEEDTAVEGTAADIPDAAADTTDTTDIIGTAAGGIAADEAVMTDGEKPSDSSGGGWTAQQYDGKSTPLYFGEEQSGSDTYTYNGQNCPNTYTYGAREDSNTYAYGTQDNQGPNVYGGQNSRGQAGCGNSYAGPAFAQPNEGSQGYQGTLGHQEYQGNPGYQGHQEYQGNPGYQGHQEYQGNPGYQGHQEYQDYSGYQGHQEYQDCPGYQGHQGYQDRPGYQGNPGYQEYQGHPGYSGYPEYQPAVEEPVKMGDWLLLQCLLSFIPCVGVIMVIVWAFSKTEKQSKVNFCKAYLIVFLIKLVFSLFIILLWGGVFLAALEGAF